MAEQIRSWEETEQFYQTPGGIAKQFAFATTDETRFAYVEYPNGERGRMEYSELTKLVATDEWKPISPED